MSQREWLISIMFALLLVYTFILWPIFSANSEMIMRGRGRSRRRVDHIVSIRHNGQYDYSIY